MESATKRFRKSAIGGNVMQQGSEEWFQARLGKVTASRVAEVAAKTKTGWGASRANYMAELIAERLTGATAESFTNAAMQHGLAFEPEARDAYSFRTDSEVELVGFVPHPGIELSGASPDGLIGSDGLVEIKCPNTATHIDTLLSRDIQGKYITQMQWQLACTGRDWCDFVSYDPRLPERMRLFVKRVERDNAEISRLETLVSEFLAELDEKIAALNEIFGAAAVEAA
ncbi:MAG: YqaJ viral recombinase family protein [Beijerinckiaceae bacterium]|nr:YqaJ viral recombinase family protein [Beijerinckiaceae bacterium]